MTCSEITLVSVLFHALLFSLQAWALTFITQLLFRL